MIVIGYNKTRSTNGKDKSIARFLPEEVGVLLVKYLTLVRPAEAFIAEQIECEGFENYEKMLFTDYERVWDGKRLSEIFMREMNEWGPASMGFQEYRQIANLWMKKHLKEVKLEEDVLDHQAGHNSATAEAKYGITSEDMDKLTPEKLLAFFHASQQWHRLLGFKVGEIKRKVEKGVEKSEKESKIPVDRDEITALVKSVIETGLREVRRNFRTRRFKEENPGSSTAASVSSKTLKALRKFYDDKRATFKSPQQAKALQLIIEGKKDVLTILPTGGGKSLLFFLPTLMESGKTTVVIVPLIAITDDLRDRCVKSKISCANWDPHSRYRERCDLLFVAVEHAVEPAFLNHLQIMHGMGILKRIVMDEAHVSLTHRDFRPDMEKLVIVMRTVPVQVVLLTATMPPSMEQDLRVALACSVWEVVRAETTRREIGYEVVEVNEGDELDVEIAFRIKKEMQSWSRNRNGDLNGDERGIVYCLQKGWAKDLCQFLNKELGEEICDVYHADLSKEVRTAVYREWQEGTVKILVATSALGLGIDYGQVRFVIHQGQSRSLMDFSQESGRAGRDGKEARSVIFTSKELREKCEWIEQKERDWAGHLTGGFTAMKEWVAGRTVGGVRECRRVGLGSYMDGQGTNCLSLGECVWCDICNEAMGESTESEEEGEAVGSEMDIQEHVSESEGSEMDMEEYVGESWSHSTIDRLEENMMVADQEQRVQVDTAVKIKEMMSVFHKRCVLCWVNKISARHELSDCREMPGKCIRCQSRDHSLRGCMNVRYRGGYCCYKCGLPQRLAGVHIHREISAGTCEEGYMDKMLPLCWYLWRKMSWKRRLEAHFRGEWLEDEFREWICKVDRGLTNGVRVMLWVWDELEG